MIPDSKVPSSAPSPRTTGLRFWLAVVGVFAAILLTGVYMS